MVVPPSPWFCFPGFHSLWFQLLTANCSVKVHHMENPRNKVHVFQIAHHSEYQPESLCRPALCPGDQLSGLHLVCPTFCLLAGFSQLAAPAVDQKMGELTWLLFTQNAPKTVFVFQRSYCQASSGFWPLVLLPALQAWVWQWSALLLADLYSSCTLGSSLSCSP